MNVQVYRIHVCNSIKLYGITVYTMIIHDSPPWNGFVLGTSLTATHDWWMSWSLGHVTHFLCGNCMAVKKRTAVRHLVATVPVVAAETIKHGYGANLLPLVNIKKAWIYRCSPHISIDNKKFWYTPTFQCHKYPLRTISNESQPARCPAHFVCWAPETPKRWRGAFQYLPIYKII